jgi:YHS domain-containing protein
MAITMAWQGQLYYFCAKGCRDEFVSQPDQFTVVAMRQGEQVSG